VGVCARIQHLATRPTLLTQHSSRDGLRHRLRLAGPEGPGEGEGGVDGDFRNETRTQSEAATREQFTLRLGFVLLWKNNTHCLAVSSFVKDNRETSTIHHLMLREIASVVEFYENNIYTLLFSLSFISNFKVKIKHFNN